MLRKQNPFLASIAVEIKLSKLGLDSTICRQCGKVQLTTKEKTLCKHCQE